MSNSRCSKYVTHVVSHAAPPAHAMSSASSSSVTFDTRSSATSTNPSAFAHAAAAEQRHTASQADTAPENRLDTMLSGISICDIDRIDNTDLSGMDALYAHAYALYRADRLDEAERLFRFLCTYRFHDPHYAIGLGAVFQLKKAYLQAIEMYATAYIVGDTTLRSVLYAGHCRILLDDIDQARACFELVRNESDDPRLRMSAAHYLEHFL